MRIYRFSPDHFPYLLTFKPDRPTINAHVCKKTGTWVSLNDVFEAFNIGKRSHIRTKLRYKTLTFQAVRKAGQRKTLYPIVPVDALTEVSELLTNAQRQHLYRLLEAASTLQQMVMEDFQ